MRSGSINKSLKLIVMRITKYLIAIIMTCFIASCEKAETDYKKLEGSTWEAVTDDAVYLLQFLDEHVCNMHTMGKDSNTLSANMTTYYWRYRSDLDSRWGYFHMFPQEEDKHPYSGSIENKNLYLHIYENDIDILCFEKTK